MPGAYINDIVNNVFAQCRVDCYCFFLERTFLGSVGLRSISAIVKFKRREYSQPCEAHEEQGNSSASKSVLSSNFRLFQIQGEMLTNCGYHKATIGALDHGVGLV